MSIHKILFFALSIFIYSCSDTSTTADTPAQNSGVTTTPVTPTTTPEKKNEPPQNAQGVWHYTCPKGCAGGGGSAVPCGTCGTTLAHNTAYHSGNTAAPVLNTTSSPVSPIRAPAPTAANNPFASPAIPQGGTIAPQAVPKAPEPAQNAQGVWHYTCSKGCAGGAGSAIACAGCGQTLAHNTAYHN